MPSPERFDEFDPPQDGAPERSCRVFLAGSGLPERWRGRAAFTILETGFGPGLNFLNTWAAWRADPQRPARLDVVSVQPSPLTREELSRTLARWPEFAALAAQLQSHWPSFTPGMHRLHFDAGQVTLTLLFGDPRELLPQLACRVDAFYLDGFSPARDPTPWPLAQLGRLAASGATLAAASSVSAPLRDPLSAAGFECDEAAGSAAGRELFKARRRADGAPAESPSAPRHALVIGAGLAGSSIAHRLAERGWRVDVVDGAAGPGEGASGNLAGVLRPLPSLDDNRLARLTRAGTLYGLHHLRRLTEQGLPVRWDACGVLHLARAPAHEAKQRRVVEAHQPPADYLRYVEREEASTLAGWPVAGGGWWFPSSGWVNPPSLCAANLAAYPERIHCHFGRSMAHLEPADGGWTAYDASGAPIATAPVAILANGVGITRIPQAAALPVRSARGQVSHLPAAAGSAPQVVVCRLGYVSPAIDGQRCAGATFAVDDEDPALRDQDHRENLAKLGFMLPGYAEAFAGAPLAGRVGFRPASPDRLPMVGAVPAATHAERTLPLESIARHRGLYALSGFGARGLVWAALVAELLASQLSGEPLPLERDLVEALDPARYLLRPAARRLPEEG